MMVQRLAWPLLLLLCHGAWSKMVSRCPEGWVHQSSTDHCFRIHSYGKLRNFEDARSYCIGHSGDLAAIEDVDTKNWLALAIAETDLVGEQALMWVGAENLDGVWSWVDSTKPVDTSIVEWEDGGSGDCAAFTLNSKLQKYDCGNLLHFICYRPINVPPPCNFEMGWEQLHDQCYKKSENSDSWNDGRLQCKIEGGDLVTVTGESVQQFVYDAAIERHDNVWIGLTEEGHSGTWAWSDGTTNNTYTHWADGQPESLDGFGAAVVDHENQNGKWVVEKLTDDFHYVCQKAQGSCVAGWEEFGDACYYFNTEDDDRLMWEDAKATCESVGAQLVVLDTVAEDEYFRAHMPETDQLWIGLYSIPDKNDLYWVDGTTMGSKNFTFMTDENINDAISSSVKKCTIFQTREESLRVTLHSSWVPTDCNNKYHYACEIPAGDTLTLLPPSKLRYCPEGWENNLDHCYLFSSEELSWPRARERCKAGDGELVSVLTVAEQDYVSNNQKGNGWIGFNDRAGEGNFEWSDGNRVVFTNWDEDEPNGNGGNENCGEMRYDTGFWNDLPCELARVFSCKRQASEHPIGPTVPTTTPYPDYSGCGWDWTENPVSGECYRIELQELSFEDARHHCEELSYHEGQSRPTLVSMTTAQEQSFIESMLDDAHLSQTTLFIGLLNDYEGQRWIDDTPTTFFNWNDGEPNGVYYDEDCGEMYVDSGKWNDISCIERRAFICEKKGSNYVGPTLPPPPEIRCADGWKYWNNHCYYFGTDQYMSWEDARSWCQSNLGSDLASILSEDENNYVNDVLYAVLGNAWIGLHDDNAGGDWHWMDGSNLDYANWMDGEPNNNDGNEHCGEIRSADYYYLGQWNDMPCNLQNAFVCKTTVKTCPESWTYHEGKCYYASNFEEVWSVARDRCKEFNTESDLVSIHSQSESEFFGDVLTHSSLGTWIGYNYNSETGEWEWSDGQDSDYENWNEGEPNNLEAEGCTEIIDAVGLDTHTKWNNMDCGTARAFGCEFFPTHSVGCEDGWQAFDNYCYLYVIDDSYYSSTTFEDAKTACQSQGAEIVSIHTQEEDDFVFSLMGPYDYVGIWIGLTDDGHYSQFAWTDNTDITYTNYEQFYYNPSSLVPSCAYLGYYGAAPWGIDQCTRTHNYVCKKAQESRPINPPTTGCNDGDLAYKGSCYNFPNLEHSWEDAKGVCESAGSHLIVINDRYESAFISSYLGLLGERGWIGLKGTVAEDNSITFDWVNGDPVEFTNWAEYEPAPTHGTCVAASGHLETPGLWEIRSCTDNFQYICEYDRDGYVPPTPPTTVPPPRYCADGWDRHEGKCYKVFTSPRTWGFAEGKCSSYGAFLTSVEDHDEMMYLISMPGIHDISSDFSSVWIGLHSGSDGGYYWTDGSPVDFVNWGTGQPDSHNGRENCVRLGTSTTEMADAPCETFQPFICEAAEGTMVTTQAPPTETPDVPCDDDPSWLLYQDYCYKFVSAADDTPQTWWESHRLCRNDGGELASIHSYEENYWIESKMYSLSDEMLWTGGRAKLDSGYEWLDGSVFEFVNWAEGEPNNFLEQEDCIAMYTRRSGYWNDQNCAHVEGRICKRHHLATVPTEPSTAIPDGHCSQGWVHAGSKCLKFYDEKLTFDGARNACKSLGAGVDMVSVHSANEQAYITAVLGQLQMNAWLGLRDVSGFFWVDQTAITYTNWAVGEPNGKENECVEAYPNDGTWNDVPCTNPNAYICMKKQDPNIGTHTPPTACQPPFSNYMNYSDACYRVETTPKTWQEAEAACVAEGSHLASVEYITEGSFLWAAATDLGLKDLWIGLNNLNSSVQFVWSDGWPVIYTNWAWSEPNDDLSDYNCVWLSTEDEGHWLSEKCAEKKPFVCKHEDGPVPTADPPITGTCPDSRWLDLHGSYCYLITENSKNWDEANTYCIQENSQLASIHSQTEMDLIITATQMYNEPLWIGLVEKNDGFGWSDNTAFNYDNWKEGEPNSGSENCGEFFSRTGDWNDAFCTKDQKFICKTPKQQTVEPTNPPPIKPTTTTQKPDGGSSGSLNAGGIVGIVIAVLFVVAGVGFVGVHFMKKKQKPASSNTQHSFDNALYNERHGVSGGNTAGTLRLDNPAFDAEA